MKRLIFSSFCLLALFTGCFDSEAPMPQEVVGVDKWLPLQIGDVTIEVQIPLTRHEMQRGLMERETLPPNAGMLFPYRQPQQLAFWMANTRIPLDIGFFDSSGKLLEIHRMAPFDTSRTQSRSDQVQYALEMNQGWFAKNDLFPGVFINLASMADALRARGADPAEFGIE